ncbi:MAG TPA: hypothetical protein VMF65_04315 [Acidimicrobiales bacterium]|nr:hypothetical protein [Acidimicrobiales bacterium]
MCRAQVRVRYFEKEVRPFPPEPGQRAEPPADRPGGDCGRRLGRTATGRLRVRVGARGLLHAGLLEVFGPERVRDTPISEQAIVGAAMGAAMTGVRFGAQHAESVDSWLMAVPGLQVVVPSTPADVASVLRVVSSVRAGLG